MTDQQLRCLVTRFEHVSISARAKRLTADLYKDLPQHARYVDEYKAARMEYYTEKIRLYTALRLKIPVRWWRFAKDGLANEIYSIT